MKDKRRLVIGLVLAVAGTMLWADLSWAQCRGGGGAGQLCPVNQTSQNTWQQGQGQGQGNPNDPTTPGFRGRGQGRGGANAQGAGRGSGGPQGRGMNPQANTPNNTQ